MRLHDKDHSWEALNRLIPDMLAAGFVGCPFICPDMIGGGSWTAFLPGSSFEPELFIRSAQIHALCPMMQISASPWRVLSAELQDVFRKTVALRQRFAPRFVELAKESARTGEPMMRNLEYAFPGIVLGDDIKKWIEVLNVSDSGTVLTASVGDMTVTGGELRDALELRSASFEYSANSSGATLTTKGFGHGVGMSQYGANAMASEGKNWREILEHYYPGCTISEITVTK